MFVIIYYEEAFAFGVSMIIVILVGAVSVTLTGRGHSATEANFWLWDTL